MIVCNPPCISGVSRTPCQLPHVRRLGGRGSKTAVTTAVTATTGPPCAGQEDRQADTSAQPRPQGPDWQPIARRSQRRFLSPFRGGCPQGLTAFVETRIRPHPGTLLCVSSHFLRACCLSLRKHAVLARPQQIIFVERIAFELAQLPQVSVPPPDLMVVPIPHIGSRNS